MSTHGTIGFILNDSRKASYVHSDGYPTYLLHKVLTWAKTVQEASTHTENPGVGPTWDTVREQVAELVEVNENDVPTPQQAETLVANLAKHNYPNPYQRVSTGQDWYAHLRGIQDDLGGILAGGFIAGAGFDTEWAYLVDLNDRTVKCYYSGALHRTVDFDRLSNIKIKDFCKVWEDKIYNS